MRTRFRNLGTTALHLAYVAQGSLVATIVSHPKLWDVAAGALIAETAGAIVSDRQGGKIFPVDLDTYEGQELEVMSANKKVHTELLQLLKS
ncbi:MAG: inositol monophosphatase family protein [Planctomycetota bacterium]|jgi:myo-inositol-1(or 4)-monophosphatase